MQMNNYATPAELPVVVKFDHQPEEETIFWPEAKAQPGCDATVSIYEVNCGGVDITDRISPEEMVRLEDDCFQHVEDTH